MKANTVLFMASIILAYSLTAVLVMVSYLKEKHTWNNGVCRRCGKRWDDSCSVCDHDMTYSCSCRSYWFFFKWTRK